VFAVTAVVFLVLGYVLGRQIDDLRRLSTTNPLTNLANRRAFQTRLRDECRRARRSNSPLSLLLIDIDGLKPINDERGHAVGDRVLRTAAHAINTTMRVTDVGARWGGDEFAIVAPNTPPHAAHRLAHRLLTETSRPPKARGIAVTVSVGVATLDPHTHPSTTVKSLLDMADSALYGAKREGRNRVNVA
jgi:diguanylate cyclase (GGDEF)-like protein